MKKFIISITAISMGMLLATSVGYAESRFNSPGAMPTVTVANATTHPCARGQIDGCWRQSDTAVPGDAIAVHIYYKNTSNEVSQGTTLSIQPKNTNPVSSVTYTGGVASMTGPRAVGSATIYLSTPAAVTYMPGTARWYPSAQSGPMAVDENGLFGSSGFNIGDVMPGEQGVLVANFRVGPGTTSQPVYACSDGRDNDGDGLIDQYDPGCSGPTDNDEYNSVQQSVYECSDGRDNDGDGLIDYPNDPGCTSRTDNSEYNYVRPQICEIDDFAASRSLITKGDAVTLSWRTTGADSVDITPGFNNRNADGSVTVYPTSTTTYRLTVDGTNCSDSRSVTVQVKDVVKTAPQAITTVATILSTSQARLNGIAIPNTTTGTTTAWFEYGPTPSLGYRTNSQTISTNQSSSPYSDIVSGLVSGKAYYYRAVVQNQNGIAYGEIVRFQTLNAPKTIVTPPQVVRHTVVQTVAPSAPLIELNVESDEVDVCPKGEVKYTVTYKNTSTKTVEDAVLTITYPKDIKHLSGSKGDYDSRDRTLTIDIGRIRPGEERDITVRGEVYEDANIGDDAALTASMVYTNSSTKARGDAVATSLITVSDSCDINCDSDFALSKFLPDTLLEWLLLILVILGLILIGRSLARKKEQA